MRRGNVLIVSIFVAGLVVACGGQDPGAPAAAPAPERPPGLSTVQPKKRITTPAEYRQQAKDHMDAGDYAGAVAKLEALMAIEAAPDDFSSLSFAYLQLKRWTQAIDAGQRALKLNPKHPQALYNVGMAYLESGSPCQATGPLRESATLQPARHEPRVALARAYRALHEYALAAQYAVLSSGAADAQAVVTAVEGMRQGPPPADLAASARAVLKDGALTLYLYPEPVKNGCNQSTFTLYAVTADGRSSRLPLGALAGSGGFALTRADLPGGVTGYWLKAPAALAVYLSPASDWRLVTYRGDRLDQVVLVGPDGTPAAASLESQEQPALAGNQITSARASTESGATDWVTVVQLAADLRTAMVLRHDEVAYGTVTEIGERITIRMHAQRPGVQPENLTFSRPLNGEVTVLKNRQKVLLTAIAVGMPVRVTDSDSRLTIELLQQE